MPELYLGLMSGTSLDGVDAVICDIQSTSALTVIDKAFTPYPNLLKQHLSELVFSNQAPDKKQLQIMHQQLGQFYADCSNNLITQSKVEIRDIAAIANHGQTIRHCPDASPPYSLQIGCPEEIHKRMECPVIYDFRSADIEAGGQGAPLMPAFHDAVFKQHAPAAIINIGGIANITIIRNNENTIGFDTGPGNTLLDNWIFKHKQKKYDSAGQWAKSGTILKNLLTTLLSDDYFNIAAPKSTGPDYFNINWLQQKIPELDSYRPKDIQTTLLNLTSHSISHAVTQHLDRGSKLYLCGGGTQNTALLESLESLLPNYTVTTIDELGLNADWVEAIGFAWLGYCHLHNIPSNLPSVTGAKKKVVLGKLYLGNNE